MPNVRKIIAQAFVGTPRGILDFGAEHGLDDDLEADAAFEATLDAMLNLRTAKAPYVPTPVLARPAVCALTVANGESFCLTIILKMLGFRANWQDSTIDCDYISAGFSGRELRGLIAARTGGRPDQVALHFLDASERQIAHRRKGAAAATFIPEIGWTREHARRTFAKLKIEIPAELAEVSKTKRSN